MNRPRFFDVISSAKLCDRFKGTCVTCSQTKQTKSGFQLTLSFPESVIETLR